MQIKSADKFDYNPKGRNVVSKYDPIREKMGKLRAGQAFLVPRPNRIPIHIFFNRVNAALHYRSPSPPKGCEFLKSMDGNDRGVIIECAEIE